MQNAKELYEKLETCTDDQKRLDILFDIATGFLNFDEKRVLQVAEEIKELAERIDSNIGRCYYHASRGRVFFKKSLYADCETEFNKSLEAALLTDDLVTQAMCHDSLGILYNYQYRYQEALDACHKALATYQQMPGRASNRYIGVCYNNIGAAYQRMYELEKSEQALLKGLEVEASMTDSRIRCNLLNNLCLNKIRRGLYNEGLVHITEALAGFKAINHKNGEVHAMVLMAHCYLGKGEYGTATSQYLVALKILKEVDHKTIEIHAIRGLGEVYMKLEAFDEALKHFQKAYKLSETIGDDFEACEMAQYLAEAYSALHQHDKALATLDAGIALAEKRGMKHLNAKFQQVRQSTNNT